MLTRLLKQDKQFRLLRAGMNKLSRILNRPIRTLLMLNNKPAKPLDSLQALIKLWVELKLESTNYRLNFDRLKANWNQQTDN